MVVSLRRLISGCSVPVIPPDATFKKVNISMFEKMSSSTPTLTPVMLMLIMRLSLLHMKVEERRSQHQKGSDVTFQFNDYLVKNTGGKKKHKWKKVSLQKRILREEKKSQKELRRGLFSD